MAQDESDERSWAEYRRLILAELERIDRGMSSLNGKMEIAMTIRDEAMSKMRVEIAMLKVQAGIWGAASGMLGSAVISAIIVQVLKH